jgi:16S rRNA (guanine(966)-N(2))-methyltransferase RsmD
LAGIRVISGKAKGRRLKMVPGGGTRPVTDRVKEALFNILGRDIVRTAFWDVFAGTGSVGIEALSRGAGYVYFTDNDRRAIDTIRENLAITDLDGAVNVDRKDFFHLIQQPASKKFDIVYLAPPQYKGMWSQALSAFDSNRTWLHPDAWIIAQIDPVEFEPFELPNFDKFDERTYGSTMLLFYELINDEDE